MKPKHVLVACLVAGLAVIPAPRAVAQNDRVVIIGGPKAREIARERLKDRNKTVVVRPATPVIAPEVVAVNREIQAALNHFGFSAGVVDGVIGQNTRNAISQYQAFMGYPITGVLSPYEQDFLVTSYHRALAGGAVTAQVAASSPMGMRGLLKTYQQELAAGGLGTVAATPQAAQVAPPAPAPAVAVPAAPAVAAPVAPVAPTLAIPNFMVQGTGPSLTSHCASVTMRTNAGGGMTVLADMTDPAFALNEQFCLARGQAVAQGQDLARKVAGLSPDQVAAQCDGLGPLLADHVAGLSVQSPDAVLQGVNAFVQNSGMPPGQLAGTAKICLSVGYDRESMDVAIGSALLMVALGERVYAELVGHHLGQGFGVTPRPDLALGWYDIALGALETGAIPVFAPDQPERSALIRAAANQLVGRGGAGASQGIAQPTGVPNFGIPN
ncbi:peptidoglycan-binding domain-containing protein [Rhodovulum bhavnagarense]|uniref:peptidoglycan-binding domain-containing protein n=1 Tax=Rhodovulum bhavnagarense TaxID=992286 RepID=UPI001404D1BE|nr:peptidoglycan-binding domain-containing protein [Rhodovulum bhavnagarense]